MADGVKQSYPRGVIGALISVPEVHRHEFPLTSTTADFNHGLKNAGAPSLFIIGTIVAASKRIQLRRRRADEPSDFHHPVSPATIS